VVLEGLVEDALLVGFHVDRFVDVCSEDVHAPVVVHGLLEQVLNGTQFLFLTHVCTYGSQVNVIPSNELVTFHSPEDQRQSHTSFRALPVVVNNFFLQLQFLLVVDHLDIAGTGF